MKIVTYWIYPIQSHIITLIKFVTGYSFVTILIKLGVNGNVKLPQLSQQ